MNKRTTLPGPSCRLHGEAFTSGCPGCEAYDDAEIARLVSERDAADTGERVSLDDLMAPACNGGVLCEASAHLVSCKSLLTVDLRDYLAMTAPQYLPTLDSLVHRAALALQFCQDTRDTIYIHITGGCDEQTALREITNDLPSEDDLGV